MLAELEPRAPRGPVQLKAAYHDACHLQHAQGVRAQPRRLLQAIPGVSVREIAESEICCGSAGIYNLLEPEAATQLRDRKVQNILKTDAEVIVSGNPGCLLQIATGLEAAGRPMRIMHLVEVLDQSIRKHQAHGAIGAMVRPPSSAAIVTDSRLGLHDLERQRHVVGDADARRMVDVDGVDEHGPAIAARPRDDVPRDVGGHDDCDDAAVGDACRAASSAPRRGAHQARRARGGLAVSFCSPGISPIWVAFGAVAYAVGMTLAAAAMRSIRVSVMVPAATGVALAAAGAYQLTQWKQICLRHCRSPLDFFARHEIRRAADSWRFGLHHGAYCAACCWGLMVIQLALGVMSVPLMALVALVILLEKQWRHGEMLARVGRRGVARRRNCSGPSRYNPRVRAGAG